MKLSDVRTGDKGLFTHAVNHHCANGVVVRQSGERLLEDGPDFGVQGIQFVRPIERDDGDEIVSPLDQNGGFVGFLLSHVGCVYHW
jgi:hypothetical protein